MLVAARRRLWLTLKQLGREVVRQLIRWCVLPLAVVSCLWVAAVSPALLEAYRNTDYAVNAQSQEIVFHVDQPSAAVTELLLEHGVTE